MGLNNRKYFDGYYIMDWEFGTGTVMVLTAPWRNEYRNIIESEKISALRLSDSAGWIDNDLSFISDLRILKGLEVYSWKVKDISPIQKIVQLQFIGIQCRFKNAIDFSLFKALKDCYLVWQPQCDSLFSCVSLKSLNIEKYPYEDLACFKRLINLEDVRIASLKLKSLKGIEGLSRIKSLDLYNCQQLMSLKGVDKLKQLKTLEIDTCKKISSIEPVAKLGELDRIKINNCGKIETLRPLEKCIKLRQVFFIESTNIEDGNMSIFFNLPHLEKVVFANRRHYSNKREHFVDQ